jgi:hypothetical protein
VRVVDIRDLLLRERRTALDTRDPLAIRRAGDRYRVIMGALASLDLEAEVDPATFTIALRDAARALGHSVRDVQAMAREGRLATKRTRNEVRVPLAALL